MVGTRRQVLAWLMDQSDEKKYSVDEWKPKRSGQQNGYYWTLCTQIADRMRMSKTEIHNRMLRDYGQPELIEGQKLWIFIPDTDEAEATALRSETFHIKPTPNIKNGAEVNFRAYYHLRGSSTYNTKEMSILLDGCIQEAQSLGIQTLTPNEIERMRQEDEELEKRKLQKRNTA